MGGQGPCPFNGLGKLTLGKAEVKYKPLAKPEISAQRAELQPDYGPERLNKALGKVYKPMPDPLGKGGRALQSICKSSGGKAWVTRLYQIWTTAATVSMEGLKRQEVASSCQTRASESLDASSPSKQCWNFQTAKTSTVFCTAKAHSEALIVLRPCRQCRKSAGTSASKSTCMPVDGCSNPRVSACKAGRSNALTRPHTAACLQHMRPKALLI